MFGRVTIRLGIGPHSSLNYNLHVVFGLPGFKWHRWMIWYKTTTIQNVSITDIVNLLQSYVICYLLIDLEWPWVFVQGHWHHRWRFNIKYAWTVCLYDVLLWWLWLSETFLIWRLGLVELCAKIPQIMHIASEDQAPFCASYAQIMHTISSTFCCIFLIL